MLRPFVLPAVVGATSDSRANLRLPASRAAAKALRDAVGFHRFGGAPCLAHSAGSVLAWLFKDRAARKCPRSRALRSLTLPPHLNYGWGHCHVGSGGQRPRRESALLTLPTGRIDSLVVAAFMQRGTKRGGCSLRHRLAERVRNHRGPHQRGVTAWVHGHHWPMLL